jgi:hypothetical protein
LASGRQYLRGHLELLGHDGLDPAGVGLLDDGAHFRAKDAPGVGPLEQRRQARYGFHQLDSILFSGQALIHFQERHHAFDVPQIIRRGLTGNVPVHGALEQDRAENPVAIKAWTGDDPGAHLVDEREHLVIVGPGAFLNSIGQQCLGRAAAALVQRRQKAGLRLDLPLLLFFSVGEVHHLPFAFR